MDLLRAFSDAELSGWKLAIVGRIDHKNKYADLLTSEAALAEIDRAIAAALAGVGGPAEVGTAVFSLAGADWPEDFEFLEESLARRGFRHAAVYNDAVAALRAGSPDFTGVSIVCGTGAATAAVEWRHAKRTRLHSGPAR